jgi:hypothetical protein
MKKGMFSMIIMSVFIMFFFGCSGGSSGGSKSSTSSAASINEAPVADAGTDQTAQVGDRVTLDGSGSYDEDGDILAYSWALTVPAGSSTSLSDSAAVNPTFVVDIAGTYIAQLIVNDGKVDSAPDTVTISMGNSPPVANAGPDQTAQVGD